ncbi:hypothetical protein BDV35DRAFT_406549, partial [Aspergillus flavus]|uniref:Unnamed protein product n=4 Tax=Aspergillus subgen. Circumdati TaxID=2720871 RepID=A0A1S9E0B7_ASPOZ
MALQHKRAQYSAVTAPQITVAGELFISPQDLNATLRKWSVELDEQTYKIRLNEAVANVSQAIERIENTGEQILLGLYQTGRDTLADFNKFKRTSEYRNIWGKVDRAVKNIAKNQKAVARAKQEVTNKWGDNGRAFLLINNAQNWTKGVGRLARAVPDYKCAMDLLVCALVERFRAMKSGKTRSLEPGGTDIQKAIDFAKLSSRPQPISREELAVYGVKLNSQGLLDLIDSDEADAAITGSDTGDKGMFGWQAASDVPELPQAILEELTDEEDVDRGTIEEVVAPSPGTSEPSASASATQVSSTTLPPTQMISAEMAPTQETTPTAGTAPEETTNPPPKKKARIPKPNNSDSGIRTQNQPASAPSRLRPASGEASRASDSLTASTISQPQPAHAEASTSQQCETTTRSTAVVSPSTGDIGSDVQNRSTRPQQSTPDRDRATGILVDLLERLHVADAVDKVTAMWQTGDITVNPIFSWFGERSTAGYSLLDLLREEINHLLRHTKITGVHELQYGIIQQLTEMDPVWWLFNALTKMETQLYAVPQSAAVPARNIPLGGTAYISRESGKSYVSFRAKADTNSNIVLRPTLLSMQVIREISSNDVSVSQVIEFLNTSRRERRPVDKDLTTGAMQQIVTCPSTIHLQGISPLSDAITAQRSYLDKEVQAEIDILLGHDRELAWKYIQQWRRAASETIRLRFALWKKSEE